MTERPHDALMRLLAPLLDALNRRPAFVVSALGLNTALIAHQVFYLQMAFE